MFVRDKLQCKTTDNFFFGGGGGYNHKNQGNSVSSVLTQAEQHLDLECFKLIIGQSHC